MLKSLPLFLLFAPAFCIAQFTISGKVLNHENKTPVTNVSVFLSNASVGNRTADDGSFKLNNVKPGYYDLIASSVGYEPVSKKIFVDNKDLTVSDIELKAKVMQLKEVVIGTDKNRERNFNWFKEQFLGQLAYAKECTILNKDVIDIRYKESTKKLSATSDDFIEIDNNALGYKVKYMLGNFIWDQANEFISYQGNALFESLKGSPAKQKRWKKNRRQVYEGSSMHFLRAAISNTIGNEGFRIYRLTRKPNPDYKPGLTEVKKYIDSLHNPPLSVSDLVDSTDQHGKYVLTYDEFAAVIYHPKKDNFFKYFITKPAIPFYTNSPYYQASTLIFADQYVFFDTNGVLFDTNGLIYEGAWGQSRVAELLPVDYTPTGAGE